MSILYHGIVREVKYLLCLFVILLLAVLEDFKRKKIPNILIVAGIITGIIRIFIRDGAWEIFLYIPGIILPFSLLYPIYKIGGIGAGDIKLLSLLGFYLSFSQLIFSIFTAFLIGAILAIFKMIYYHNFLERFIYLVSYIREISKSGKIHYYKQNTEKEEAMKKTTIGLAAPIFLAVMLTGGIL